MVEALGAMTEGGAVGIGTAGERKIQRRKKEDTRRRECYPDTTTYYHHVSFFILFYFSSLISFFVSFPPPLSLSLSLSWYFDSNSFIPSFLSFSPSFTVIFISTLTLLYTKFPPRFVKETISVSPSVLPTSLSTPVSGSVDELLSSSHRDSAKHRLSIFTVTISILTQIHPLERRSKNDDDFL